MALEFKKAEKRKVWLKVALVGPSGSGKTYSSLLMASGIGGKIALIDTENNSAALYSDLFNFDTLSITPPYTVPKYLEAMDVAINDGYDILIVDSLSHAWAGEGGLLSKKEAMDARGGNSFANWAKITPEQEKLVSKILNVSIHLISTIRAKQAYVIEENEKGKSAPKKVGLAPVQREGVEYEFSTVLDLDIQHNAKASKDRTGLFRTDEIFQITKETGKKLVEWLSAAKPSLEELQKMYDLAAIKGLKNDEVKAYIGAMFNKPSSKDLTQDEFKKLCEYIEYCQVKEP